MGESFSSMLSIYGVADAMKEIRDWHLGTLQNPPGLHLSMTLPVSRMAEVFVEDLKVAVKMCMEDTTGKFSKEGSAAIYGMTGSLPKNVAAEDVMMYMDVAYQA